MPADSIIRIRLVVNMVDYQASLKVAAQLADQTAQQIRNAFSSSSVSASAALQQFAASATTSANQIRAAMNQAAAAAGAVPQAFQAAIGQLTAQLAALQQQIAALNVTLNTIPAAAARSGSAMGGAFAGARVEVGALTGNVSSLESGLARLAFSSSALGPAMREALPIAIAIGFEEILGRLVTHFRDLTEELTGLKALRDTQNEVAEASHRQFLELAKVREENVKVSAQGVEGTAKLNLELRGMAPILQDLNAEHRKAQAEVTAWQDRIHALQLAYDQAGGVLNGFNTLRKRDMDEAAARLKEELGYVRELEAAQRSLGAQTHAAQHDIGVVAEKQSLEDRKAILEAQHRMDEDNYSLSIQHIKDGAEQAKIAGQVEQRIADDVYRYTLEADKKKYDADVAYYDGLKKLAEEKGRTGADVKPEITGYNASEMHSQAQQTKDDLAAQDVWLKALAKDAKESAEAVGRVLAQAWKNEEEAAKHAAEEGKKGLEERERLIKETAKTELEATRASLDERIRFLNEDRAMTIGKASEEIAMVRQAAAQEIQIVQQEYDRLRQLGVADQAQYEKLQQQRVEIARQTTRQIEDIQKQEYQQFQQIYNQMASTITRSLNQWIQGQKTFGQAMKELWNGLVMNVIEDIEKMAIKWVEQHTLMAAANALFHTQTAAQDTAADAVKVGQQAATNELIVQSNAGAGAAAAFASVLEALPFPANVIAAPPVAALALAQIEAFGATASLEHGGVVPGQIGTPTPVVAHGGEMYLGSKLSQTVQNLASGGGATRSGAVHNHMSISPTFVSNHPLT
ncbi:MAG: hypothetical protein KGL39_51200, partial [Patescibacteria group bacterium]|nr:hypothetical protein [Patescibacteria group bacterium]